MALYLKYRPQDFSSLVWQEFIKETLKAAVEKDKTVGAYLFTGPRGTGKTSTARIFAKAINCEDLKSGDPCGKCEVCSAFAENSLIDIVEIDAASHTGVDNIREIIEKAQFSPTRTKYKIYIIDEVHMLSKGAFNALLKILEEPPEHIKFILATTEIHKVPETILSRCQRYDFKNFSDEDITGRLKYIAKAEWITVDEKSYEYITKNAEGWMRNAVSLFEQLVFGDTISFGYIEKTLGIAKTDEILDFIEKLRWKNTDIIWGLERLMSEWKNLKNFFKEILSKLSKQAIENLQSWKNISDDISIMEGISDMLMKSKNSFDECMTYKIGLLKIISWYTPPVDSPQKNQKRPPVETTQTPQISEIKKETIKVETELAHEDVADLFATESSLSPIENSGSDFDINSFTAKAKEKWAKAAVVMSLKWSQCQIVDDELQIKSKTKISYNTLSKPEVKEIFLDIASENELGFIKVTIS